ncbi:MAG: endonuclease/exonuclease/phosphatase family protein [Verrucomicrobiales bacterium]
MAAPPDITVATFNVSLSPNTQAALAVTLANPGSVNPKKIAEIIQRVAPDVLFINELNHDGSRANLDALHDNFIAVPQNGQAPQNYPHRFVAASNTGIHSGFDLNNSGSISTTPGSTVYGDDCLGFGRFPGQYAMAVLSKFPIREEAVRTFGKFLWQDMPGALLPDISGSPAPNDWYRPEELAVFRLSSKSHWDVPVVVDGHLIHLLGSHPTPPTFDGPEDRNGRRNHDEIRLWADYIDPARDDYIYDDKGNTGGLGTGRRFVIVGDQNADPDSGDSVAGAARQFTRHPLIDNSFVPASERGGSDTAGFAGGLRVDYVLPSRAGLTILGGGVFWPASADPLSSLVNASDHRMVHLELRLLPLLDEVVSGLQVNLDGDDVILAWSAAAGVKYSVWSSGTLTGDDWLLASEVESRDDAGTASIRDAGAAQSGRRRFYRVEAAFD